MVADDLCSEKIGYMKNSAMTFNYDTTSQVWLEPFSLLLNTMFPSELIYSEWCYWKEVSENHRQDKNFGTGTQPDDIETGSRVEGFCIPELHLSDTETALFKPNKEWNHWIPDKDVMTIRSHIEQDGGSEIPIFTVDFVEEDRRYVELRLTEQWKKERPKFKNASFLHHTYLLPLHSTQYDKMLDVTGRRGHSGLQGPVHKHFSEGRGGMPTHETDTTTVFSYPTEWPECAMEWLVRPRSSGWPSPEMVQEIVDSSCHIAPVGRGHRFGEVLDQLDYMKNPLLADEEQKNLNKNDMDGIEWRISFSVAENKLSASVPLIPRHIIVILKMIKKLYFPDTICTYHLKNLLFWEMENQMEFFWNERNTAKCVIHLLDRLHSCLRQHSLPHYFIPESNLFSSVESEVLDEAAKIVENVRVNIVSKCMSMFRRLLSLTYLIQDFNHSLHIEKYLHDLKDGNKNQEKVKYFYCENVLLDIIGKLKQTLIKKAKAYNNGLREIDNKNMHPRLLLPLYIYQSLASRLLCETFVIKENGLVKSQEEFVHFIKNEIMDLRVIDNMPSIEQMCLIYFNQLIHNQSLSNAIPQILEDVKENHRLYFQAVMEQVANVFGPLSSIKISDKKDIDDNITKKVKKLSLDVITKEEIEKLVNNEFAIKLEQKIQGNDEEKLSERNRRD